MDKKQARTALLGINIVVGVAFLLAPKLSMRVYGLDPDADRAAAYPVRYVGARSVLLAALLTDDKGSDLVLRQLPLLAGVDATASAFALATGEVPRRAAVLGALTSAVAVAFGFLARD